VSKLFAYLGEVFHALVSYARGQVLISLILSAIYAVGFGWIGVPLWPLIALICGFLNLIPYAGGVIALLLASGATLIVDLSAVKFLQVLAVYAAARLFESFYLTPHVHGKRFSIRPLLLLAVLLASGILFGPLGMLLAVPVVVVGRITWRHLRGDPDQV